MTASGRIITVRENRPLARCNDEYGFHIARLTKDGKASSHNVFELWKQTFPELEHTLFKGALKAKYGTGCKLIDKPGIHFNETPSANMLRVLLFRYRIFLPLENLYYINFSYFMKACLHELSSSGSLIPRDYCTDCSPFPLHICNDLL